MKPVTRITRIGSWARGDGRRHRTQLPVVAPRLRAIGLFGALGLAGLAPATARAQAAGQSTSTAYVYDYATNSYACNNNSGSAATTSATCPATATTSATGTSTTSSSNAARTATASATLTKTGGPGPALETSDVVSTQASALTVTGTPSAGDQLVFHFLTSQSAMGSGGSTGRAANVFWELYVKAGPNAAYAYQYGYANGMQDALTLSNATQTATGFDLTLPFSAGPTFNYLFGAFVQGYANAQSLADGATLSGSISAYLKSIDAETANGMFISSASFDQSTGFGTISATPTTTTPEPSSLALLGTGVIGLIPAVRRRKS